jgi:TetR/AcrR family fatty acid metabolism transcriptional regulator
LASAPKRADKRRAIREAATEVFAEKGFHQARVSDIARKACVADGTIYLYFRNKEDLLLNIFEDAMERLASELTLALKGVDDPLERIRVFARNHFGQVRDHRSLAEVMQVEIRQSKKFLHDYRPESLWRYLGMFAEILREGKNRGQIREDVDPFIHMWSFFGSLDELGMQWVLSARRGKDLFNLDTAAEQIASVFIRGVTVSAS